MDHTRRQLEDKTSISVYALPRRADKRRLCVVRRIPGSDAELQPALRIDRNINLPQAPGVIVLFQSEIRSVNLRWQGQYLLSHVFLTNRVPDASSISSLVKCAVRMKMSIPIRGNLDSLNPVPATRVGPSFQGDLSVVHNDLFILRRDNSASIRSSIAASTHQRSEAYATGIC